MNLNIKKQGLITEDLLKCMNIEYVILSADADSALNRLENVIHGVKENNTIRVVLIKKDTFSKHNNTNFEQKENNRLDVDKVIGQILDTFPLNPIFSTTGKISRRVLK